MIQCLKFNKNPTFMKNICKIDSLIDLKFDLRIALGD